MPTQFLSAGPARAFATTHWSMVLSAGNGASPRADDALSALCQAYWFPLYAYVRRQGYDQPTAKDLTQEFFAQLLGKHLLAGVDPTRGKFRSWLLGVMNHFLAREWSKARAQKRGGGQPLFSWDELEAEQRYLVEPAEESTPERMFDRRWAFTVLERAISHLREEYDREGKGQVYKCLRNFVSAEASEISYKEAAGQLGLTVAAVKSAIYRMRQRYQELVREEIAQTVSCPEEIEEEIRYLLAVIRGL